MFFITFDDAWERAGDLMNFDFGQILTQIFFFMRQCVGFLQTVTFSFASFTFSLWDFCCGFLVLWLVVSFIFPWFGEDEE